MVGWIWSSLLRLIARNRAVSLAILSAIASALIGLSLTWHDASQTSTGGPPFLALAAIAVAMALIVLAGAVPAEYEAAERLDLLLPVIYHVLDLRESDRLTIHRLRTFSSRGYEQITEYYPSPQRHTQGRVFPMSHGIVAQCFSHPGHPVTPWSIPDGQTFEHAMSDRWMFTDDETRRLSQDRRSFLAYPIGQHGSYAAAVLYLDSSDPSRFAGPAGADTLDKITRLFDKPLSNALKS